MPPWRSASLMLHQLGLIWLALKGYYATLRERFTCVSNSRPLHLTLSPIHPNFHRHAHSQMRIGHLMKKTVKVFPGIVSFSWIHWSHGLRGSNEQSRHHPLNRNTMH